MEAHGVVVVDSLGGRSQVFVHIEEMHILQRDALAVDQLGQNGILVNGAYGDNEDGLFALRIVLDDLAVHGKGHVKIDLPFAGDYLAGNAVNYFLHIDSPL